MDVAVRRVESVSMMMRGLYRDCKVRKWDTVKRSVGTWACDFASIARTSSPMSVECERSSHPGLDRRDLDQLRSTQKAESR